MARWFDRTKQSDNIERMKKYWEILQWVSWLDSLLFDDDFRSKCLALKLICEDRCKVLMQKGIKIPK